jgi:hypothetical protein
MIGANGPANISRFPSQLILTPLTTAMASVIGKSQLDVWGAAIITQRSGTGSGPSTTLQRQRANQIRARIFATGGGYRR